MAARKPQRQPAAKRAREMHRQRAAKPPTVAGKLAAFGIDAICAQIVEGKMLAAIAADAGVAASKLIEWLAADAERSARAREARAWSALLYDERAEAAIAAAKDGLELQKARELAHHYRWRASKIAPRVYGDRVQLSGADDLPAIRIDGDIRLSPAEAYARMVSDRKAKR